MAFVLLLSSLIPAAGEKGDFVFVHGSRKVRVWTYEPANAAKDAPVVVVMHGVLRNGEAYREPWIPIADRHRCVVLVPEFSQEAWPGSSMYNYGGVKERPRAEWAYTAIDAIFDDYKKRSGRSAERYHLFGHSAGSQFVHRMVLLVPEARYATAVAANAGSYTMPDASVAWPYGLGGAPVDVEQLKPLFQRRLIVQLGERDVDPADSNLPKTPEAQAQGPHRLARGKAFFERAKARAAELGVPFAWELHLVPGVGHDNKRMAPAAAELLFGKR